MYHVIDFAWKHSYGDASAFALYVKPDELLSGAGKKNCMFTCLLPKERSFDRETVERELKAIAWDMEHNWQAQVVKIEVR